MTSPPSLTSITNSLNSLYHQTLQHLPFPTSPYTIRLRAFLSEHQTAVSVHLGLIVVLLSWLFFVDLPRARACTSTSTMKEEAPETAPKVAHEGAKVEKEVFKPDPPKDDPISLEELKECDGSKEGKRILVAIKGAFEIRSS